MTDLAKHLARLTAALNVAARTGRPVRMPKVPKAVARRIKRR